MSRSRSISSRTPRTRAGSLELADRRTAVEVRDIAVVALLAHVGDAVAAHRRLAQDIATVPVVRVAVIALLVVRPERVDEAVAAVVDLALGRAIAIAGV